MYIVRRRPAAAPVLLRWYGLGAAPASAAPVPIGALAVTLNPRFAKLRTYDLFLRDRTALEWIKDNSGLINFWAPMLRSKESDKFHAESHEFWTRLSETERKAYVREWVQMVDEGARLQAQIAGDARAPASATLVDAVKKWAVHADAFVAKGVLGARYAEHLMRNKQLSQARALTEKYMPESGAYPHSQIIWRRMIGLLNALENQHDAARHSFDEAVEIARTVSVHDALIESLVARGIWHARHGVGSFASNDLEEALRYCIAGSYRLLEIDARIGLGWLHLRNGDFHSAETEASAAARMSERLRYHWGGVDAARMLAELRQVAANSAVIPSKRSYQ